MKFRGLIVIGVFISVTVAVIVLQRICLPNCPLGVVCAKDCYIREKNLLLAVINGIRGGILAGLAYYLIDLMIERLRKNEKNENRDGQN